MVEIKNSLGLSDVKDIFRNLDRETLINNAIDHDGAVIAYNGATIIETGIFTGRSPKDKYFVNQDPSNNFISWGDVNKPSAIITGRSVIIFLPPLISTLLAVINPISPSLASIFLSI